MIQLSHKSKHIAGTLDLTSSKSESNRVLIIQQLCATPFTINQISDSDDTKALQNALKNFKNLTTIDVGPAGTTMRFLTSFLSLQPYGKWILTGSKRMQERPISVLVDALQSLGGKINYLNEEGYPPLEISGSSLRGHSLEIDGSVSSQFLSSLLLIAPNLPKGIQLKFTTPLVSKSYLLMTTSIMNEFGADISWKSDSVKVESGGYSGRDFTVEADWSAASYWYSLIALSISGTIQLNGLKKESLQGDSALVDIYSKLGVETKFTESGISITKVNSHCDTLTYDMENCPDIAQTVLVSCAALGVETSLSGLQTLKIKETDRLLAMQNELAKCNVELEIIGSDKTYLKGQQLLTSPTKPITTYHDHRMAMSFAPLCLRFPLEIENENVVSKSYPNFWADLKHLTKV